MGKRRALTAGLTLSLYHALGVQLYRYTVQMLCSLLQSCTLRHTDSMTLIRAVVPYHGNRTISISHRIHISHDLI